MTIKQQGGIFGRNPSFNDLEAEQATVNGVVNIQSNRPQIFLYEQDRTDNNARIELTGDNLRFSQVDDENSSVVPRVTLEMDTGNFSVDDGNLVIGTSGKGIDFSATSGTGTSELFDDYEEGTYEPSITGSTSGSATLDTSFNTASYVKIGTIVHVNGQLRTTATTVSGTYQISLPFTAVSGADDYGTSVGSMVAQGITYDADTLMAAPSVSEGEAHFTLFQTRKTSGWLNLTGADVAAGMRLRFQLTYRTA